MPPRLARRHVTVLLPVVVALATVMAVVRPAPAHAITPLQDLSTRVLRALSGSTASGVALRADVQGVGVIAYNSATPMRPASTEKLLTTSTALLNAGAGYQFTTTLSTTAPPQGGVVGHVLQGDLVLRTSGDPTLTRADLDDFAVSLKNLGVWAVAGGLYADARGYATDTVSPGWQPGFLPDESGPVGPFVVDRNAWRTDPAYLSSPTYGNLDLWRQVLAARGISVRYGNAIGAPAAPTTMLEIHYSAPLSQIIRPMLKNSDNFMAEQLLRMVGEQASGYGTRRTGAYAVYARADGLGISRGTDYDGSGLSYYDRATADELIAWLEAIARTPDGPVLRAALPVSCVDGTLRHRLCGYGLTGRVQAKTGTLDGVRTLAGYTTTWSGRKVTFAVMLSGIRDMTTAQQHIDAAVLRLATYTG